MLNRTMACGVLALLFGLAACSGNDGEGEPEPELPVQVHVTNQNWHEIVVFAIRGSSRYRLGSVRTDETRVFDLNPGLLDPGRTLQLLADPIGARKNVATPQLVIGTGQSAYWRVTNDLDLSNAQVY